MAGIDFAALFLISLVVIIPILIIAFIALWIWMLIDCAQRNFKKENDKIVWILIIAFLGFIGAIVYYFVVKRKK